jgi:hypothetical protein
MTAHFCWPQVEATPGHKFSLTPYFSIIIGVTLSVLLCLLLSFVKRGMRNRRLRCAVLWALSSFALDSVGPSVRVQTIAPCRLVMCLPANVAHEHGAVAEWGAPLLQAVQGGGGADGAPAAPGPRREHGAHRVPPHARVQGVGGGGAAAGGRPRPGGAQVCTGTLGLHCHRRCLPCSAFNLGISLRTRVKVMLCCILPLEWPFGDPREPLPTLQRAAGRRAAGGAGDGGGGQRVHGVPGGVPGRGGAAHAALRPLLPRRQVHRPLAAVAFVLPHVRPAPALSSTPSLTAAPLCQGTTDGMPCPWST